MKTDPQKAASVQALLADYYVKIADILDQKKASPYLGVSHRNFTIFDVKKRLTVILRMKQSAEKVPSTLKYILLTQDLYKSRCFVATPSGILTTVAGRNQ
jgi:hypothetical protein